MSTVPFQAPHQSKPLSISQARNTLPPEEFRNRLRSHLLDHPGLTLAQVARQLKVSRQCVAQQVGKLNRPDCTSPLFLRLAPRTEEAKQKLPELARLVSQGLSAERAAAQIHISLPAAIKLGFRSKQHRPPHGTSGRAHTCTCWRCRKQSHPTHLSPALPLPHRGRHIDVRVHAEVHEWLAWRDPYTQEPLTQVEIGKLTNIAQAAVSRIAKRIDR